MAAATITVGVLWYRIVTDKDRAAKNAKQSADVFVQHLAQLAENGQMTTATIERVGREQTSGGSIVMLRSTDSDYLVVFSVEYVWPSIGGFGHATRCFEVEFRNHDVMPLLYHGLACPNPFIYHEPGY